MSQSTISLAERGHLDRLSLRSIRAIFAAVEASYGGDVVWRGGQLDRLLDARHASLVESTVGFLRGEGWQVLVEVSFNHFGDRGSIDVLAFHAGRRVVVVVEVKSEIAAIEETVRRLDVKARLAPRISLERFGVRPAAVARMLVLPDSTSARGRVATFDATFGASLPLRATAVRRWMREPDAGRPAAGIVFLRGTSHRSTTQRSRRTDPAG